MLLLGNDTESTTARLGTLALTRPLLDKLRLAEIVDRLAPADPQQEFSHGQVLAALLAARLDRPLALVNVQAWAADFNTELLFGIPPDKLNDDRLGRSLDALFDIRHSLTAAVVHEAMRWAEVQPNCIHFDPTEITAHVDDLGALPISILCYDGNRNGHTGIRDQLQLLHEFHTFPQETLMVSDRGTFSAEHLIRLKSHGQTALCAVPWNDYRDLFDTHRAQLNWQPASFLSQEQQRRRDTGSSLPHDSYRLAVLRHQLTSRESKETIDCRVIFVHSTASEREERIRREENIVKIREGLTELAAKLQRGHPQSTTESLTRQVVRLLGKKDAAQFFSWQMVPLTVAEREALPPPRKGFTRPTHRLEWSFDETAAAAAPHADGISVMVTTAPLAKSADGLFTQYKKQCYTLPGHG